ncbi:MAG: IclR family transcriptional regulator [Fuerstiella sp.]
MSQPLGTLVKAMNVLDALGAEAPVGVLDLSRRLKMDKSAVSRILTTFRSRDYVQVRQDGRYDLGLRLFELGQALQERMPFREAVIPHVDAIARESKETAFAAHYSQGQIAYLYDCVSTQDIRLGERRGLRVPVWNHPAGKAIMAYRDPATVSAELAAARRASRRGLPTVDSFRRELARVRRRGYAEQRDADTCLLSVPVLHATQPVNAALMLGGPAFRMAASRTESLAAMLTRHAAEVSKSLGWV